MSLSRVLGRRAALPALCLLAVAGTAAADGLDRFNKLIKPDMKAESISYKSAKALGDNGFVLEDVVVNLPPDTPAGKPEPVAIKRIAVEDLDFAAFEKKAPPNFVRLRVEGIAISGKPTADFDLKQLAGIDRIAADFQLDYRLDPERQTFTLNRLELDLHGLARIEVTMILDGVSSDMAGDPGTAMDKSTLRTASFVYEDRSLLSKVVPAVAKAQGTDPAALIALGKPMVEALRAGQGKEAVAALDAVTAFAEDYSHLKGPLRITFNPPGKTTAAALSAAKSADDVVKALGLVVSYAGAVPKAAAAKPACTPGARLFVWHEDAWQSATVLDATKSGDRCVTRIDGGGIDDITVPLAKTAAWTIDGPGKAVSACNSGDRVLVENDGSWYPAKVTAKTAAAGQCAIKFDGDDGDDEKVPMKRVRALE